MECAKSQFAISKRWRRSNNAIRRKVRSARCNTAETTKFDCDKAEICEMRKVMGDVAVGLVVECDDNIAIGVGSGKY